MQDLRSVYAPAFTNYVEGIYVEYKYYETAAQEGFIDYDKTVQYPFGYGLSYTEFEQKMGELEEKDGPDFCRCRSNQYRRYLPERM